MTEIVPFHGNHIGDSARLVSRRYQIFYEQEPLLPGRYQDVANLQPLIQNIFEASGLGVAALQDGELVGFLIGWLMPGFRGKRSVYSPEWANAAGTENRRSIYEQMYKRIAEIWVAEKNVAHYISFFANDLEAINIWNWLGFGMISVDAVRGLHPIKHLNQGFHIRRASIQDIDPVIELNQGLVRYSTLSPSFFITEQHNQEYFEAWLCDSERSIWLAELNEEPVAFLRVGPANDDVSMIIYDEKTISIYGAYTEETMRGKGIATALLAHVIETARITGYGRIAVDFESMNTLGARFWLNQGFRPVCHSFQRFIDERLL